MNESQVESSLASLIQRRSSTKTGLSKTQVQKLISEATGTSSGFEPEDDTPVVLADQGTGTQNAWTTLNIKSLTTIPSNARYGIIQFQFKTNSDADIGEISYKGNSEIAIPTVTCNNDQNDNEAIYPGFVKLRDDGTMDYYVAVTGGAPDWKIRYIGYSL